MPPDTSQYYTDPAIEAKRQAAESATSEASNYQSAAGLLPGKLKQAIQEKLDYNKDIISQQNKAMADYFAAPSQARVDYQDIWNPFQREALVAKATSNAYAPYATLTDILGQRRGNIEDIVNAGTGAFNSAVGAQQNKAQIARQGYQDALGLASQLEKSKQWQYEQATKGSGGSSLGDLGDILSLLTGVNGGQSNPGAQTGPNEAPPTAVPSNPNKNWHSPQGEWEWNSQYKAWVPVGVQIQQGAQANGNGGGSWE